MDIQLILFDVDGTLVDTGGAGKAALHRAFAETFGSAVVTDIGSRTADVRFAGRTDPLIIAALADALGCEHRLAESRDVLETRYLTALEDEMARPNGRRRVIPGIPQLMAMLDRDDSIALGLVTGNIEAGARLKLEPFGLNRFFPGGGFGSDHADRRQVARLAVAKLSRLTGHRFAPERVTVVGDTEHDVDCARANGYRAVAVATGWVSRDDLVGCAPDAILDTIDASPATLSALGVARADPESR